MAQIWAFDLQFVFQIDKTIGAVLTCEEAEEHNIAEAHSEFVPEKKSFEGEKMDLAATQLPLSVHSLSYESGS